MPWPPPPNSFGSNFTSDFGWGPQGGNPEYPTGFRRRVTPMPWFMQENPFQQMYGARNPPSQTNNTQGYQPSAPQTAHSGVGADTFWTTPKPTPWVDQEYGDDLKKRMGDLSPVEVTADDYTEALDLLRRNAKGQSFSELYGLSDDAVTRAVRDNLHLKAGRGFQDSGYINPDGEDIFLPATSQRGAKTPYEIMREEELKRAQTTSAREWSNTQQKVDAIASHLASVQETLDTLDPRAPSFNQQVHDLNGELLNAGQLHKEALAELAAIEPYDADDPQNVSQRAIAAMNNPFMGDLSRLLSNSRLSQRDAQIDKVLKEKWAVDRTNRKGRQEAKDAQVRYDRTNRRAAMVRDEEEKARLRKARGRVSGQSHSSGQSMAESVRRKPQRRLFGQ